VKIRSPICELRENGGTSMSVKVRKLRLVMKNDEQKKKRRRRNERPNFGNVKRAGFTTIF